MAKMLEILGLGLVTVMFLGFTGLLRPTIGSGLSPLFWGCAGAVLMIIIYRKIRRDQAKEK